MLEYQTTAEPEEHDYERHGHAERGAVTVIAREDPRGQQYIANVSGELH